MTDIGYPDADYAARITRARQALATRGLDALAISVGRDLPYLLGYEAMPLERLTMAVVTHDATPVLVVPELEAPRVHRRDSVFEIRPWGETEDPVGIVADLLSGSGEVAIGSETWAMFLLSLQDRMPGTRFVGADDVMRQLRIVKDADELAMLRAAGAAVDSVVMRLREHRFAGRTEREVAHDVADMTLGEGHQVATFNIVAAGPNSASPHHEPGERVIEPGDAIVIDFGGRWHGYGSDTTRTFHVGEPSDEFATAYAVLAAAQRTGVESVQPGVTAESIDVATRNVIEAAGYGDFFIHRTGHGIGLDGHEHPYLVAGNTTRLEPGMAFSVEPGIYVPQRWGMRIEDIVAVTEDGVENFNNSDRSLAIVE